ncbi:MAG: hypothetical protein J6U67_08565, partial [Lachnospiraceae bacterium]|nr:hypothetical protein [Lachnospiraceae bacterium]
MGKSRFGKRIVSMITILSAMLAFASCMPVEHTYDVRHKIEEDAKLLIKEYLDKNFSGAISSDVKMVEGDLVKIPDGHYWGNFPTYVAKADFEYSGESYRIYADTDTKEIYTDYYFDEVMTSMSGIIEEAFFDMGMDVKAAVTEISIDTKIENSGIETKNYGFCPTTVRISDAISSDIKPENIRGFLDKAVLDKESGISVSVSISEVGRVLDAKDRDELNAMFPGISSYKITEYAAGVADIIRSGAKPPKTAGLLMQSRCSFYTDSYFAYEYDVINEDYVYINVPVKEYTEDGVNDLEIPRITVSYSTVTVDIDNELISPMFVFFKDLKDPDAIVNVRRLASYGKAEDDEGEKYSLEDCGGGYYTLRGA